MNKLTSYLTKETIFIGITVSAAFLLSSALIGNAITNLKNDDQISVSGTAEKFVRSDSGKWTFTINTQSGRDELDAKSKLMRDNVEIIAKYLVNRGIDKGDIQVRPVTLSKVCAIQQQESYTDTGKDCSGDFSYALSQRITVSSSKVDDIQDLSLNAATLMGVRSVVVKTESVEYFINSLASIKTALITEAMANAKERAEALAKSTDSSIGGVKNASQGVFQITGKNSVDVSDYGTYDTNDINKKVTAVVRASFSVK